MMQPCGCFDGPWSEVDMTLVSVRCDEHAAVPVLEGHVAMRRNVAGIAVTVETANRLRMAIPRARKRRRR